MHERLLDKSCEPTLAQIQAHLGRDGYNRLRQIQAKKKPILPK